MALRSIPAAMSRPLYGIVGIDQSETTRGNKGFETRSRKGKKRGGIRRRRTFGSNKFDPSGIIIYGPLFLTTTTKNKNNKTMKG